MWNDLSTMCLTPERWIGSMGHSRIRCFPELCFIQFPMAQVQVGLQKQFINDFAFPTSACAVGFNNINNNNISMKMQ